MAKKVSKKTKRKNYRLKKSARWTIAGLLMATAIIIALIPVQNGGVSAITTEADLPSIDELSYNPETGSTGEHALLGKEYAGLKVGSKRFTRIYSDEVTSVSGNRLRYAYPYQKESTGGPFVTDIYHSYYRVDTAGMPEVPIPIYEMGRDTVETTKINHIRKFLGGGTSGYKPVDGVVNLGREVIVNAGEVEAPYITDCSSSVLKEELEAGKGITQNGTFTKYVEEYAENEQAGEHALIRLLKQKHTVTIIKEGGVEKEHPSGVGYEYNDEYVTEDLGYFCKNSSGKTDALIANISYIDDGAFENCSAITNLEIPSNINAIGNAAFRRCGIEVANIDTLCRFIGDQAFFNCKGLVSVNYVGGSSGSMEYIGDGAFAQTSIFYAQIPTTTMDLVIGSGAYMDCDNLGLPNTGGSTGVDFSKANDSITLGCYAFAGCDNLLEVDVQHTSKIVSHDFKDEETPECGVFSNCRKLLKAEMGESFKSQLPLGTFASCPNLTKVKFDSDKAGFYNAKKKIGDETKLINDFSGLDDITIEGPEKSQSASDAQKSSVTFAYLDKYGNYVYDYYKNQLHYSLTEDPDNVDIYGNKGYKITKIENENGVPVSELDIPYMVDDHYITSVGGAILNASEYSNLRHIKIPDSITEICDNAFSGLKGLETVSLVQNRNSSNDVIPAANVLKLGKNLFAGDSALTDIYFRHYSYDTNYNRIDWPVIDPNIEFNFDIEDDTENKLFKTDGDSLTVHGRMYIESGAWPDSQDSMFANDKLFEFCMNEDTGAVSPNHYVTYVTDGYECLEASKGDLIKYPTKDTNVIVGRKETYDSFGKTIYQNDYSSIEDLAKKDASGAEMSLYEKAVLQRFDEIVIPEAISSIEKAGAIYDGEYSPYFQNLKPVEGTSHGTKTILLSNIDTIPDNAFASLAKNTSSEGVVLDSIEPSSLERVDFLSDLIDVGKTPFANSQNVADVRLSDSDRTGDNQDKSNATADNPYYWIEDGVLLSYYKDIDGTEHTVIEECLPASARVDINEDLGKEVTAIRDKAFENCDNLEFVDLSRCEALKKVPDRCFYDCDKLSQVKLPESCTTIGFECFAIDEENPNVGKNRTTLEVVMEATEIHIPTNAFDNRVAKDDSGNALDEPVLNTLHSYDDTAASRYAENMKNVKFSNTGVGSGYWAVFDYWDANHVHMKATDQVNNPAYFIPNKKYQPSDDIFDTSLAPVDGQPGYVLKGWTPNPYTAIENLGLDLTPGMTIYYEALYEAVATVTPTPTKGPTPTTAPTSTGTPKPTSGPTSSPTKTPTPTPTNNNNNNSNNSNNSSSSSNGSKNNNPVVISGAPAPVASTTANASTALPAAAGTVAAPASSTGVQKGNTNVVSQAKGIHGDGQMSATVNGSSDNYIIKISETTEAEEMAKAALGAAFGSLDNIRYMPFDISLYDSTGTQKISPVPEGVTVSVTMPIPDDLVIYGGNNKIGSTRGGTLETIQPRFTVIDGVPCMNYTVSHLSPYVVYVDTANLTEAGTMDATPKTGDPIHPKWFLCIGLAAISIFLFLKRDRRPVKIAQ